MTSTSPSSRLFKGYGPLVGMVVLLVAMTVWVPTKGTKVRTEVQSGAGASVNGVARTKASGASGITQGEDGQYYDAAGNLVDANGNPISNGSDTFTNSDGAGVSDTSPGADGGQPGGGGEVPTGTTGCGEYQVPGDPYSPPCVQWSGDNGGATANGVTGDTIKVSVRLAGFSGGIVDRITSDFLKDYTKDSPEDIKRTLLGLQDFVNEKFQLYGRKIQMNFFDGSGNVVEEILGGGQPGAEADSIKAAEEIGAFAELAGVTPPYADSLARRGVISIGAPFMSREWLAQREGLVWSSLVDGSSVAESVVSYYGARMAKRPATLAGGSLYNQPRRVAIIAPDNSWYQESVQAGVDIANSGGFGDEIVAREKYRLDLTRMAESAASLISKLKDSRATTVICACDPVLLVQLTSKATQQGVFPEWLMIGVAFADQDFVGRVFDQQQWKRAIGVSYAGEPTRMGRGAGYQAYKAMRSDEPAVSVDMLYAQLEVLAIGIQMATADLTPANFRTGMDLYPTRKGPLGSWSFGSNDFTTADDAREVYWSPSAISKQTGNPGAYVESRPGERFPIGSWPSGDAIIPGLTP